MRYSDFKKLAGAEQNAYDRSQNPGNYDATGNVKYDPAPGGHIPQPKPKPQAPTYKKLPIAQDEVRVGYNDPAALRVAQAQTPILAQTMPGQQQPKPGFQFDYDKDLHNARQNAANQLQQMRRDTAAGKQVDTTGLTPTQYRYVASGAKGSGYNVQDTDEAIQNAIYNPDPKDEQWRQQQRQAVVEDLRTRQANGDLTSEQRLKGLTDEEKARIAETREQGVQKNKQLYEKNKYQPQQRDLDAMSAAERKEISGNSYSMGGLVAGDTFKAPLAPGETYTDRAKEVIDAMRGTVADSYHFGSDLSKKNTDAQNFEIWRKENPEQFESWFNSLESAFGNSNIDALTELQKMAAPGENGEPSKLSMLPPEYRARLQKAGETATWNAVKDNPLNINKAIGLWLRQNGHGGMADFVSDSILFYGSLAGLLAGGVVLGGMFGGDDDDEDRGYAVGGPRYNPQEPAGYNRIPYT